MERKGLNPSSGSKMCALLQKHLWPVGYILIDNKEGKCEYYLYLTDYYFMVSGYNLTKLGPVLTSNTTIKTYVVDSYNLSSESMGRVCTFSGFSECKEKNGNLIN